MRALLCLGRLKQLELLDPASGRTATIRPQKKWLAWDGRNLHICTVTGTLPGAKLPAKIITKHQQFHNQPPKGKPFKADCPTKRGAIRRVGLISALVYTVPKSIKSPTKNPHLWHHAFGDTGHKGGKYPTKVMPELIADATGNIFIKRRKGNIYNVDDWIRG